MSEDYVLYESIQYTENNELYVFGVADGAGSSRYGGDGAKLIVNEFVGSVSKLTKNMLKIGSQLNHSNSNLRELFKYIEKILYVARIKLIRKAYGLKIDFSEFSTTFVGGVAFVNKEKRLIEKLCYLSVGDSVIIGLKKRKKEEKELNERISSGNEFEVRLSNEITKGEFENQTGFITSIYWEDILYRGCSNDLNIVIISTDGLSKIFFNFNFIEEKEKELLPYRKYIWKVQPNVESIGNMYMNLINIDKYTSRLEEILKSPKIFSINPDDKGMVVIWI